MAGPSHALNPELEFFQYEFGWPPEELGIPDEINDIAQDRTGFLWLATGRGLMRFDGLEATLYRVSTHPEVLSNRPERLFVDSKNRLFIASERGLSMFADDRFQAIATGTRMAAHFHAVTEGADGIVWLGSKEGLYRFDNDSLHKADSGIDIEHVRSLLWHNEALFVGGRGRVFVIDANGSRELPLPQAFGNASVRDLEFHQGQVWGTTRRGLIRIESDSVNTVVQPELAETTIDVLLSDRDNNLWLAGHNVVARFLPDGRIELPDVSDSSFGFEPEVTQLFEDSLGRVWHASRVMGLAYSRDTPLRRVSFTEGLPSPNVTAVTASTDGTVFVATDGGISTLVDDVVIPADNISLPSDRQVMSMFVDGSRLFAATSDEIQIFDLDSRDWLTEARQPVDASVNAILPGNAGTVWVGTDAGLYEYQDGDLWPISGTVDIAIESLMLDANGDLWLGTESGVARLVDGAPQWETVELQSASTTVVAMTALASGDIAAVTADRGLLLKRGGHWRQIGEDSGIPPEKLIDIESRGEWLWLVTGAGIFRVPLAELDEHNFEFKPIAAMHRYRAGYTAYCCHGRNESTATLANSDLVVGTSDGVLILDQRIAAQSPVAPMPYIHDVQAGSSEAVPALGPLIFDAQSRHVEIRYSAIQLTRGDQVRFRYRLAGLSQEWTEVGTARVAQLTNLPPGEFRFELQASLLSGDWSSPVASVEFSRVPALLELPWVRALLWLGTIAAALIVVSLRMLQLRNRRAKLDEEIVERTADLQDINSELKNANRKLERSNQTDPLTGLVNRRFFDANRNSTQLAERVAQRGVLAVVDIDFFKRINDSYGHAAGDEVLCQFASALRSAMRESDLVARWGGEEFLLLGRCPGNDPSALLDRVVDSIRDHGFKLPSKKLVRLTCSIGAIQYPLWPEDSLDERLPVLMELADTALYAVKMHGRDGWALLSSGDKRNIKRLNLQAHRSGLGVNKLVEEGYLRWRTNRDDISLSLFDTVTRLHALKSRGQLSG